MGLWADTFGGGNTLAESIANVTTGGDGARYESGNLVHDGGADDGKAFTAGTESHTGDTVKGTVNSTSNDGTVAADGTVTPQPKGVKDVLAIDTISPNLLITKGLAWLGGAKGTDPYKDIDGQRIYTKDDGSTYTMNFLNMPYDMQVSDGSITTRVGGKEVVVEAGKYVDKLSIVNTATGKTGYEQLQIDTKNSGGGDDEVNQIIKAEQDNAATGDSGAGVTEISEDSGAITPEKIAEWATSVGMDLTEQDQKDIVADPSAWLTSRNLVMADVVPEINADAEGTTLDATNANYDIGEADNLTAETGTAATTGEVSTAGAVTYDTDTNQGKLTSETKVDAVVGTIDSDNLVDADDIEIDVAAEAAGTGVLGNALNDFASQNISSIIDTSTVEGKLLAEKLGEGNYTDHKATILGQMEIISAEFSDSNGEPRIPSWAQATLREVQKSIAFGGMTGTGATAAYANAIMEATLGVAKDEATFFQTITIANLDNRQEAVINKAKILANFELGNLSAREAAAVQNAKAFIEMDLANLSNEQQAEIINKEAMVQALFEDTKAINANRLFTAETQNEINQFYDNLNAQVAMKNTAELNAMRRFNAGEINDTAEFNANMDESFAKFHSEMQYNIDVSNAKWRQTVETGNTKMAYEAASTDLKNRLDISTEAQNRLWDRTDAELDMIFKAYSEDADRDMQILKAQITAQASMPQEEQRNAAGDIIETATKAYKLYKTIFG